MKIYTEKSLSRFEFWSGAKNFANKLTYNELDQVENCLEEIYPGGMDETDLNDLFWFEPETVCDWLGLDYDEVMERE